MFAGTLKTFSLTSLMQICYNDSNNGTIEFNMEKAVLGKIGFENGNIVYADFLGSKGIDAIKQLSLMSELDFKFNERLVLPEKNVNIDFNFLLIDCSRHNDESREYLAKIRTMFSKKYDTYQTSFYEYQDFYFKAPELYHIKYLEAFDGKTLKVVYLDKNIHARIELLFRKKILTDDLLMFMESKDVF